MKHWKLAGSTAAIALFAGTGAFAQVTPEDVWQSWQDMSSSYGQTMTADSATRDGDTLVVKGVKSAYEKDGVSVSGSIDEMQFTDQGDGTVLVTMSDTYPMEITLPGEGGEATSLSVVLSAPGMKTTASGTPEATNYAFDAATLDMKLSEVKGAATGVTNAVVEGAMTGVSGKYSVEGSADAKKVASEVAIKSLAITVSGADEAAQSDIKLTANVADIAGKSTGNLLNAEAMADMAAALKKGFATEGNFTHGAVSFDMAVTDAGKPTEITGSSAGGSVTFALDANRVQYGTSSTTTSFTLSSADLPFPEVKLGYDELAFNMLLPVGKSDSPSDFAFLTKLVGFSVSDEVWGMLDPTGALPHDPATVIIDTKGTATLKTDLMDAAAMEAMGDAPPADLNSLDVTELKASIAGAELTGAGAFTFDNTDLATFGGVPAPTGKLDLKLVGGNTLLDKLVAMGLLTQDDVAGARMMASMFANTAADKDEMTSTLEFKDKGFFANGQQLQ